jgi:hypothetical protein
MARVYYSWEKDAYVFRTVEVWMEPPSNTTLNSTSSSNTNTNDNVINDTPSTSSTNSSPLPTDHDANVNATDVPQHTSLRTVPNSLSVHQ